MLVFAGGVGRAGSRRRPVQRRGAALVEGALYLLPFLAVLFGIMDFGVAIWMKNTIQHAVREGVRYAVTYQTAAGMGHDSSIKQVVKRQSMGVIRTEADLAKVMVRYFHPTTLAEVGQNSPGNIVEVSVENLAHKWMIPFWWGKTPLQLSARASDRMEGLPGGLSAPPAR